MLLADKFKSEWLLPFLGVLVGGFFVTQPWDQNTSINFVILIWVVGLAYLCSSLYQKKDLELGDAKSIILIAFIVFLSAFLSWINSDYEHLKVSLIEPDLRFLLLGFTIIAVVMSKMPMSYLYYILTFAGISYGIVTVYQVTALGMTGRVNGDENAIGFGNGAMLIAVLLTASVFLVRKRILQTLMIISAASAMYAAFMSGTRGSFLALPGLLLFGLLITKGKVRTSMIVVFTIAVISLFTFTSIPKNIVEGIQRTNVVASSTGQRIEQWRMAICMAIKRPILGTGPKTFRYALADEDLGCQGTITHSKGHYGQVHSMYLNTLATKGVLGFVSLMAFFAALFWFAYRNWNSASVLLSLAVITLMSYTLTIGLLYDTFVVDRHLTLIGILLGLSLNMKKQGQQPAEKPAPVS